MLNISLLFLEMKHKDVLLSFLHLVCLLAVEIPASEAPGGSLVISTNSSQTTMCVHTFAQRNWGGVWL